MGATRTVLFFDTVDKFAASIVASAGDRVAWREKAISMVVFQSLSGTADELRVYSVPNVLFYMDVYDATTCSDL